MLLTLAEKWHATVIEQWPDDLRALGNERIELRLPEGVLLWIAEKCGGLVDGDSRDLSGLDEDFLHDLKAILESLQTSAFIRLGVCSFKIPGLPLTSVKNVDDALMLLCKRNVALSTLCHDCVSTGYPVHLYVSEWRDIPAWSEFRLFIRDRKLIGVSQHHHQEAYPEIQENLEAIKASLIPFSHQLIDALHMDTVVADVFIEQQGDGSFKTTLIELNPFIQRTDPCLYSWKNGGNFDGGIRYRKLRHNPYRNTTSAGRSAEPLELFREEDYRRH